MNVLYTLLFFPLTIICVRNGNVCATLILTPAHNPDREKFVQEQLKKRRMGSESQKVQEELKKGVSSKVEDEDLKELELYKTPENLLTKKDTASDTKESGDRWLTGISEVPISIE